jgi:DNA-binding response OmpR family regulator
LGSLRCESAQALPIIPFACYLAAEGDAAMRVLLVEDDEMIGRSLKQALEGAGWSADWVRDGELAQSALGDGGYTCVLLDLGLPRQDGTEVLRRARERGDATPVLVLTARDGLDDRIHSLDLGADDYLLKPFEFRELLARMRAVVRRRDGAAHSLVGSGALQLDLTTREVVVNGAREALTAREFALLHALLERPGAILSREQLENRIYGWGEEVTSNAIDVLIHGMRRKLGADSIRNVRGLGWRVAA